VATFLKRLLAVVLVGSLVAVVAYATAMPNSTPGTTASSPAPAGGGAPAGKGRRGGASALPVPVLATAVVRKDIPVVLQGVGTARALQSVLVRPQVEGTVIRISVREGQEVKAGDLIAEMDPSTYKAQLDQMLAKRALTQTQLENAQRDYERYTKIPGVIAQKTVDTQLAQVKQFEAQIKADTAAVANAETQLGYTRIVAPISGRAGIRLIDEGNLVRGSDAGIVTISQLDPIAVQFTLPQQQLAQVNRALANGKVVAEALDADGRAVIDTGTLVVVDNQIDQQTGTVKMKAEFPNANRQLWPGQFTNVRVRVDTLANVVTIPIAAVQRGPNGTFAYVVTADNRAEMKPITLGLQTETEAVVTAGLEPQQTVVTSGFARLTDGANVTVQSAPDVAPPAGAGPQRKRDGNADGAKGGEGKAGEAKVPEGTAGGDGRAKGEWRGKGEGRGEGRGKRDATAKTDGAASNRRDAAQLLSPLRSFCARLRRRCWRRRR
jgi:membrane fusion protein, multidrug efflux system